MKALTIQVEDTYYEALLDMLKKLPKNKITILEDNRLSFEDAMQHTLDKNDELYKRLS